MGDPGFVLKFLSQKSCFGSLPEIFFCAENGGKATGWFGLVFCPLLVLAVPLFQTTDFQYPGVKSSGRTFLSLCSTFAFSLDSHAVM